MGLSFVAKLVKMLGETKITRDPSSDIGPQTLRITAEEHVEVQGCTRDAAAIVQTDEAGWRFSQHFYESPRAGTRAASVK